MALTGHLSDLSLSELIEFFCNQRKTDSLKFSIHKALVIFIFKPAQWLTPHRRAARKSMRSITP